MGVFMQPDPIGFKGDAANIYRFCNNNAVNRTDPLGLLVMANVIGDRMWEMACFFDSGNSLQGSLAEFMQRLSPAGMDGGKGDGATVAGQQSRLGPQEPAGRGSRAPSSSDEPLRMIPPKDATTEGYERYAYYQLASHEGKPLSGGNLKFQEVTTKDPQNKFNTETSDRKPPQELIRGGLFKDHIGFPLEHRPRSDDPTGKTILYQTFKSYNPDGQPGPKISTQLKHVTTFRPNGTVTNGVYVVDP
jgi:hypothetical protein